MEGTARLRAPRTIGDGRGTVDLPTRRVRTPFRPIAEHAERTIRRRRRSGRLRRETAATDGEEQMGTPGGTRIVHAEAPVASGPSGLPIRHLVDERIGATGLFVGEQALAPGQRVLLHTHPVEEVLVFVGGEGEATLGDERVPIGPGVSLHVPPGVAHGFHPTGTEPLRLLVLFPTPRFAETALVGADAAGGAPSARDVPTPLPAAAPPPEHHPR
jgi:mannose-6-phosphate isomerase-like protein (cupin superfamily)